MTNSNESKLKQAIATDDNKLRSAHQPAFPMKSGTRFFCATGSPDFLNDKSADRRYWPVTLDEATGRADASAGDGPAAAVPPLPPPAAPQADADFFIPGSEAQIVERLEQHAKQCILDGMEAMVEQADEYAWRRVAESVHTPPASVRRFAAMGAATLLLHLQKCLRAAQEAV